MLGELASVSGKRQHAEHIRRFLTALRLDAGLLGAQIAEVSCEAADPPCIAGLAYAEKRVYSSYAPDTSQRRLLNDVQVIAMQIFVPISLDGYELCRPVKPGEYETLNGLINGELRRNNWKKMKVVVVTRDEGKELKRSDAPWYGSHALIFRHHAAEILSDFLSNYGELLPLESDGGDLFVFNPIKVLNGALDEQRSSIMRFTSGKIMNIKKYAFYETVTNGIDVFKIDNLRVSPTFVSERFVSLWKSKMMTGLEFKAV